MVDLAIALLCSLSLSSRCGDYLTICGLSLYDALDWVVSEILFPAGGLLFSIYVGWVSDAEDVVQQLSLGGHRWVGKLLHTLIRYVIPVIIIIIVISGFLG